MSTTSTADLSGGPALSVRSCVRRVEVDVRLPDGGIVRVKRTCGMRPVRWVDVPGVGKVDLCAAHEAEATPTTAPGPKEMRPAPLPPAPPREPGPRIPTVAERILEILRASPRRTTRQVAEALRRGKPVRFKDMSSVGVKLNQMRNESPPLVSSEPGLKVSWGRPVLLWSVEDGAPAEAVPAPDLLAPGPEGGGPATGQPEGIAGHSRG